MLPSTGAASFLTAPEVAERLGVSLRYVRRLTQERRLRHVRVGHFVRYLPEDVEAFLADGVREPVRAANGAAR